MPVTKRNTDDRLPVDVMHLATAIGRLPEPQRLKLAPLLDNVLDGVARRKRLLNMIQEAVGDLRLDLKYLQFDLEVTRRERDALKP